MSSWEQLDGLGLSPRAKAAHALAAQVHVGQRNRYGEAVLDHVERVSAAVPRSARPVALVHDVCERSRYSPADVAQLIGLDDDERDALRLLTAPKDESVLDHTERIIKSVPGAARELALIVKIADIEDHIQRKPDSSSVYTQASAMIAEAKGAG